MRIRNKWEVLVGDPNTMDYLSSLFGRDEDWGAHPMQRTIEHIIETELNDEERELFWLRFGEQMPYRAIARHYGYSSHMLFQVRVQRIVEKVRDALVRQGTAKSETDLNESEGCA